MSGTSPRADFRLLACIETGRKGFAGLSLVVYVTGYFKAEIEDHLG